MCVKFSSAIFNEDQVLGKATDYEINCNINGVLQPLTHKATNLCVKMQVI